MNRGEDVGERRVRRCEGESGGGEVNFSDGDALALSGSTVIKMRRVMDCCGIEPNGRRSLGPVPAPSSPLKS